MTMSLKRRTYRDRARRLGLMNDERQCPCRECGHKHTYRHVAGWPVRIGPMTALKHPRFTGPGFIDHEYVETLVDGRKRYVTQPYPLPTGAMSEAMRGALDALRDAGFSVHVLQPGFARHNEGVFFVVIEEAQ